MSISDGIDVDGEPFHLYTWGDSGEESSTLKKDSAPWSYLIGQGGRNGKNIGRAFWSDDDVTKIMTSLLPNFLIKILGGGQAPLAPIIATPPVKGGVEILRRQKLVCGAFLHSSKLFQFQ